MTDLSAMRKATKLSQEEFWGRIGVTQSGGSRYESGRPLPEPVMMLLVVAYGSERERQRLLAMLRSGRDAGLRAPAALHAA